MSSTDASKCAKSCQEPLAEKWRLANLLKTHRGPAPWWGQHLLKTAGPYLKSPWSSTGQSKCAKSHQEPPAEKWSLADLLESYRGPAPWGGQHPLKRADPYLKPPWSSAGPEYMCQITWGATGWKMKVGRSAWNSQGTCPMVGTASPEESKSLPPSLEE